MNRTVCDRQWQAEALDDGRLGPNDRASFERHATTCRACSDELAALHELRRQLSAFPDYQRTELEHRRSRQALLAAAEQQSFHSSQSLRRSFWALAVAVPALACALLLLRAWHARSAPPGFEVTSVAHADWSATHVDGASRVTLRDGVASFHVEHVAAAARFLVELPDGEIEVRGTRFVVDVKAGITRSVSVTEGVVWLRLGQRLVVLKRGEAYRTEEVAAAVTVAPEPVAAVDAPASASVAASQPKQPAAAAAPQVSVALAGSSGPSALGIRHEPNLPAPAAPSSDIAPLAPTAGTRFGEAMSAFAAGDYGRADALFAAFAREFPSDSRLEDAAFLRADARARRGDAAGAAALARDYLRRYPNGLRRPDAERLVGNRSSSP